MQKQDFMSKVVFITGASSGIGKAIGEYLVTKGYTVYGSSRTPEKYPNSAFKLLPLDVKEDSSIRNAVASIVTSEGKMDVLINNAGMQFVSPIEEFPTEKFELLVKIMLVAPFVATKHVFPIMKKQGNGRIINMASINGLVGFAGKAAYNSAKHGVIGLTKVAALEGAEHGITVNAMCPGYVDTPLVRNQLSDLAKTRNVSLDKVLEEVIYPLVPQKRLLSVQEISDYTMFLSSDKASGVTGQAVVLDGGYTAQ